MDISSRLNRPRLFLCYAAPLLVMAGRSALAEVGQVLAVGHVSPMTRACCTAQGSCAGDLTVEACLALGGTYHPEASCIGKDSLPPPYCNVVDSCQWFNGEPLNDGGYSRAHTSALDSDAQDYYSYLTADDFMFTGAEGTCGVSHVRVWQRLRPYSNSPPPDPRKDWEAATLTIYENFVDPNTGFDSPAGFATEPATFDDGNPKSPYVKGGIVYSSMFPNDGTVLGFSFLPGYCDPPGSAESSDVWQIDFDLPAPIILAKNKVYWISVEGVYPFRDGDRNTVSGSHALSTNNTGLRGRTFRTGVEAYYTDDDDDDDHDHDSKHSDPIWLPTNTKRDGDMPGPQGGNTGPGSNCPAAPMRNTRVDYAFRLGSRPVIITCVEESETNPDSSTIITVTCTLTVESEQVLTLVGVDLPCELASIKDPASASWKSVSLEAGGSPHLALFPGGEVVFVDGCAVILMPGDSGPVHLPKGGTAFLLRAQYNVAPCSLGLLSFGLEGLHDPPQALDQTFVRSKNGNRLPVATRTISIKAENCLAAPPACDDCNLNGIGDVCEAAEGDFTLESCVQFDPMCLTNAWSCFDNWTIPGDLYPNNAGSARYHVTLNGSDDVFLDVDVVIDTLRILDTAKLQAANAGIGDLLIVSAGGLLLDGFLCLGNGRLVDVFDIIRIGPTGKISPPSSRASGLDSGAVSGSQILTQGEIILRGDQSLTVNGNLTVDGSAASSCSGGLRGGVVPPPKFDADDSSSVDVRGTLEIVQALIWIFNSSVDLALGGDFANHSTTPECFEWGGSGLLLNGASMQTIEAAGLDLGPSRLGLNGNFEIGSLELAVGVSARIENTFTNITGSGPCQEAQYVSRLVLNAGSTLTLQDARLYYGELVNLGGSILTGGCGGAFAIPECDSYLECIDHVVCTQDDCVAGSCVHTPIAVLLYGDITNFDEESVVDVDDLLCMLAGFGGIFGSNCAMERIDMFPCGGNGQVDVDDLIAELEAFAGNALCPNPCGP